jgi:Transposase IS66 family
MVLPPDLDRLSHAELKSLVISQFEMIAELQRTVAALRDEIARLKGGPGRPDIKPNKPSGMEKATDPKPQGSPRERAKRGPTRTKLTINEEKVIKVAAPAGSRFKGYTSYIVQDLVIRTHVVEYRCERWVAPDGTVLTAPLPEGILGHFGSDLRRFILAQYYQGQVTVPRLVEILQTLGVFISKREVMRLLNEGQESFLDEANEVLRAGLESAAWITVDDTGARHKAKNGFCTQIGNSHFTWFGTTASKSRANFLGLLRAGHGDYVVNDEAVAYMRQRNLAAHVIARLTEHRDRHFPDQEAWTAHLKKLGITELKVSPDPVEIATEGALWGSIKAHGLLPQTVIISDDAGQFNVAEHGLCWVHSERLVHKLDTFTDENRKAQRHIRSLIWRFYRDLKAYKLAASTKRKATLSARFDRIFKRQTGFVILDRLLKRLYANKAELLKVLDHPEIPLHTNETENDIRCQVTKRKISGGTRSDVGRDCRDGFLSLFKTCKKLGIAFWDYLGSRLGTAGAPDIPRLAEVVRHRCASA